MPTSGVFFLEDFDSPDTNDLSLNITVTLSSAVDGDDEGLMFVIPSDGVVISSTPQTNLPLFTMQYVLSGASNYTQYENVCSLTGLLVMY